LKKYIIKDKIEIVCITQKKYIEKIVKKMEIQKSKFLFFNQKLQCIRFINDIKKNIKFSSKNINNLFMTASK
jgi:hypothetical protein